MANKKKKIVKASKHKTNKTRSAGWFNPDNKEQLGMHRIKGT